MAKDVEVNISKDARQFAEADWEKYKKKMKKDVKKYGGDFKKSNARKDFISYLLDRLPAAIKFCVQYGHMRENSEVLGLKNGIYHKFMYDEFLDAIKKEIKRKNKIKNIKLLPIILNEILNDIRRENERIEKENENRKPINASKIIELNRMLLEKKVEKYKKEGLDPKLSYDLLIAIPSKSALKYSKNRSTHRLFQVLYNYANTETINFQKIMKLAVPDEYLLSFLVFALLERKERFTKLTDQQKSLYLSISDWCFTTLENASKKEITEVLEAYVLARKHDDEDPKRKDTNRRYAFTSLSETEYPHIKSIVDSMIEKNPEYQKYLS